MKTSRQELNEAANEIIRLSEDGELERNFVKTIIEMAYVLGQRDQLVSLLKDNGDTDNE